MKNILALNVLLLASFGCGAMEHQSGIVEKQKEPEVLFFVSSDGLKK